jgi:hypothetical protein
MFPTQPEGRNLGLQNKGFIWLDIKEYSILSKRSGSKGPARSHLCRTWMRSTAQRIRTAGNKFSFHGSCGLFYFVTLIAKSLASERCSRFVFVIGISSLCINFSISINCSGK